MNTAENINSGLKEQKGNSKQENENRGLENLKTDLDFFLAGLKNLADAVNNIGYARNRYGDVYEKLSPPDKEAIVSLYANPYVTSLLRLNERLKSKEK